MNEYLNLWYISAETGTSRHMLLSYISEMVIWQIATALLCVIVIVKYATTHPLAFAYAYYSRLYRFEFYGIYFRMMLINSTLICVIDIIKSN